MQRPDLTMPAPEAALLRSAYAQADVILEYGSGGSTVMAGDMAGKRVFSVESDAGWIAMMRGWFAANPPQAEVVLHHGDIGPTRSWGRPDGEAAFRSWSSYPVSVWDRGDFAHPDVVLIDGRFRAACFATVALRCTRPVTVLFDDYTGRKSYHTIERLFQPVSITGRMARFDVTPTTLPPERLQWLLGLYLKPF